MGRKCRRGTKWGLPREERDAEGPGYIVVLRHVAAPEAALRLEKALELLLTGAPSSQELPSDGQPGGRRSRASKENQPGMGAN